MEKVYMKGPIFFFVIMHLRVCSSSGLQDKPAYPHAGPYGLLSPCILNTVYYLYRGRIKADSSNRVGFRGEKEQMTYS